MRLGEKTRLLQDKEEKALVGFFTAGYPDEETFLSLVRTASASCDIIEIGIPFSDPIADGPLIQASSLRALEGGMTLARSLELAAGLAREIDTPLVFMSYYNPILKMGTARFADRARASGVGGVIVPDVSFEESAPIRDALAGHEITYIDLVAPTSSDARLELIGREAEGFLYLVSVTGVTGVHAPEAGDLTTFVERTRRHTNAPLYVGFGISNEEQARSATAAADGVIIGSALVRIVESAPSSGEAVAGVGSFLEGIKKAIDESPQGESTT